MADNHRVSLHLASQKMDIWEALLHLFDAWNRKVIIKQPQQALTKEHLRKISSISDLEKKKELIIKVSEQQIDWKQFQQLCQR